MKDRSVQFPDPLDRTHYRVTSQSMTVRGSSASLDCRFGVGA